MILASRLHAAIDKCARRRAEGIARRVAPHLPDKGLVLDLGSGAGHNAEAISRRTGLRVVEADLANLARVGAGPVLLDGRRLPFRDRAFGACTLVFVLQYVADAEAFWRELQRVVAGPVLVMQSIVASRSAQGVLRLSDQVLGPTGCRAAAALGYFGSAGRRPGWALERTFDHDSLACWLLEFGWRPTLLDTEPWPLGPLRHDLFRLEPRV